MMKKIQATLKKLIKNSRGFTIIEIIIALGIFSLASLLITSSFLTLSSVQKKTTSAQEILNEFRFSIDLMGKEITSGSAFPDGCANGCDNIIFATKVRPDVPLRRIEYELDTATGIIMKGEQKTFGLCSTIPFALACYQPFTTDRVHVDLLTFFVKNNVADAQVIVTVAIQGTVLTDGKTQDRFEISSTYSPRLLQDPDAVPPSDNQPPVVIITQPTSNNTWTTGNSSLILRGTASDNIEVTEMRWRNETTGTSGFANMTSPGYATWETPAINLQPAVNNNLVAEARDAEGNVGTDTLAVNSTALIIPVAPNLSTVNSSCSNTSAERMYVDWNDVTNANRYYVYRCEGVGCTPSALLITTTNSYYNDYGIAVGIYYNYMIRAYNDTSGTYSADSNIRGDTIDACPASIPVAPNVSTVTTSCSDTGVERMYVDWNSVTFASRYDVYRCAGVGCTPSVLLANTTNSYYYDYAVTIGTFYNYRVFAYNGALGVYSVASNTRGDTIDACVICPPPSNGTETYCTICGPCNINEGDCDNDAECNTGLTCLQQDGIDYCIDPLNPPPPTESFTLSASPTIIKAGVDGSTTTTVNSSGSLITVIPTGGFDGTVSFSASNGPADIIYNFNPNSSTDETTFKVNIPNRTPVGVYTITVSGSSEGINASVNVYLDVFASGGGQQ